VKNARIAVSTTDPPFMSGPYAPHCPLCGGMGTLLGILGLRQWWRCRDCGVDFAQETR
jgi:transposase-like protein